MTKKQFRATAERLFKEANPGAAISAWTFGPNALTWPTGKKGFSGRFAAQGDGYRAREVSATYVANGGVWVR